MKNHYSTGDVVMHNWTLTRLIGEGSFGRVFEAEREDFGTIYKAAIKIIRIPQSESEITSARAEGMDEKSLTEYFRSFVEEIVREFALMSQLKGTANIVSYEDHTVAQHEGEIGWDIIIRMELLTPLLDYSAYRTVTRQDVIKLGIDICKALELCQKFNIMHRDIKPENIFVSGLGDYKLGDFGIARTAEKTMSGLSKKGTYTYMAPEIYRGDPYGSGVDIYSLGIVLYRLLNDNRAPFLPEYPNPIKHSDRDAALAKRISGVALPMPKNADGRLAEIVLKACEYNPKDRYSSPMQMREELEAILYSTEEGIIIYPQGDAVPQKSLEYIDTGKTPKGAAVKGASVVTGAAVGTTAGVASGKAASADLDKTESLVGTDFDKTEFISGSSSSAVSSGLQSTDNEEAQKKSKKKRIGVIIAACVVLLAVALTFALPQVLNTNDTGNENLIGYQDADQDEYDEYEEYGEYDGIENDFDIADYITIAGQQFSTSLTELELIDMNLTDADIIQLGYMTNLTVLRLNNNNISDISPLANLINLESLNLSGNNISNIDPLFGLTNLTNLSLAYNPVTDWHAVTHVANVWGRPAEYAFVDIAQADQAVGYQPAGHTQQTAQGQQNPQPQQPQTQQNVSVPNIVGQSRFSATSTLQNAGFTVNVREETSNTVSAGNVISQNPTAGSSRAVGSNITIAVSSGPQQVQQPQQPQQPLTVSVPNVVGQSRTTAINNLQHAGFHVHITEATSTTVTSGNVISQSPSSGSSRDAGSSVTITVSTGAGTVTVPNVVGQSRSSATSTLQNAGFHVNITETNSTTVTSGNVISQSPSSGSSRDRGSSVTITVSTGAGTVTVPNVVGQSRSSATSTLQNAGFTVSVREEASSTVTSGNIISQTPSSGSSQTRGSSVTITVSTGAQTVNVPNVVGQSRSSATSTLQNAGFTVNVREESHNTVVAGNVISQSPTIGSSQTAGSAVTITVSTGAQLVTVPNVVGLSRSSAMSTLQNAGFTVNVREEASNTVTSGNVISQNPTSGSSQTFGSAITITISTGSPPITVPNVAGQSQAAAITALQNEGFTVRVLHGQWHGTIAAGNVIRTNPEAGSLRARGSEISIVPSLGPQWQIIVPANHPTVNAYRNANDTSRFTWYSTSSEQRVFRSNHRFTGPNGAVRMRITNTTHQGQSMILYIDITSSMTVTQLH